jgi:hypothetical protein
VAKKSSKKEVLDLYASAIAYEQTKYDKANKKKVSVKHKVVLSKSEEDSSDSDESFHLIRKKRTSPKKAKVHFVSEPDKKKAKPTNETTAEEKDFLKQITHLESTDESSEKSGSSSDAWDAPVERNRKIVLNNKLFSNPVNSDSILDCYASTASLLRSRKRPKIEHLSAIMLAYLHSKRGSLKVKNQKWMRFLFDTGCSSTLISYKLVNKLKKTKAPPTNWTTKAGNFKTDQKVKKLNLCFQHFMTIETLNGPAMLMSLMTTFLGIT